MLKSLCIEDVGPFSHVELSLDRRVNVITGDNGLGKSLLLDIAFWAESGFWPGSPAMPSERGRKSASIKWLLGGVKGVDTSRRAEYVPGVERWQRDSLESTRRSRRPVIVYAMVDGGFAVFDQARAIDDFSESSENTTTRRTFPGNGFYVLRSEDVFEGLRGGDGSKSGDGYVCNGLIRDWPDWQYRHKSRFSAFARALRALSDGIGETIRPGRPRRVSNRDSRDIPWLKMPYGDIPITHASAAVRRILGLAYVLTWSWYEHIDSCRLTGTPTTSELLLLFDEVECHLHPKWQRVVLPALIRTIGDLTRLKAPQVIAATHSPLVLASLEPVFSEPIDQLLLLDMSEGSKRQVRISRESFVRLSRADLWLKSDMFGLKEPTSAPAEEAISDARKLLRQKARPSKASLARVSAKLRATLSDTDPLLARIDALSSASSAALGKTRPAKRQIMR